MKLTIVGILTKEDGVADLSTHVEILCIGVVDGVKKTADDERDDAGQDENDGNLFVCRTDATISSL